MLMAVSTVLEKSGSVSTEGSPWPTWSSSRTSCLLGMPTLLLIGGPTTFKR